MLAAALMLAGLAACVQNASAPAGGAAQAPGSFDVHIGGRLTNAFGTATY
ncbi:MAG: hypothetical protein ACREFP_09970 [Acetobacteraceae bacterium]